MAAINDMGARMNLTDPIKIADAAKRIYDARFRKEYEEQHSGQFVAIDVKSEKAYLGKFAESALSEAREKSPHGVFHLIRIGSEGAFRVSCIGKKTPPHGIGHFDQQGNACLELHLCGVRHNPPGVKLECIIDTGFTGFSASPFPCNFVISSFGRDSPGNSG